MGRRPLSLPDVKLLIERWGVLPFATIEQQKRRQRHEQSGD
jgi:hypothetical protein